mgnify:CR=1 FL=1
MDTDTHLREKALLAMRSLGTENLKHLRIRAMFQNMFQGSVAPGNIPWTESARGQQQAVRVLSAELEVEEVLRVLESLKVKFKEMATTLNHNQSDS